MKKAMLALLVIGVGIMTSFQNPILSGNVLVRDAIESENYDAGVNGWQIARDGTAEFNDVTARGDIVAAGLDVQNGDNQVEIIASAFNVGSLIKMRSSADDASISSIVEKRSFNVGTGAEVSRVEIGSGRVQASPAPSREPTIRLTSENQAKDGTSPPVGELTISGGGTGGGHWKVNDSVPFEAALMRPTRDGSNTNVNFTSTSYSTGSTTVGLTFVAPPSGAMLFQMHAYQVKNGTSGFGRTTLRLGTGSTIGSGTAQMLNGNTSPDDEDAINSTDVTGHVATSSFYYADGLTPGDTYNIAVVSRISVSGDDLDVFRRNVIAIPQP